MWFGIHIDHDYVQWSIVAVSSLFAGSYIYICLRCGLAYISTMTTYSGVLLLSVTYFASSYIYICLRCGLAYISTMTTYSGILLLSVTYFASSYIYICSDDRVVWHIHFPDYNPECSTLLQYIYATRCRTFCSYFISGFGASTTYIN